MPEKKKGLTIRFEPDTLHFLKENCYNVQSLVTRLVDKFVQEQQAEQQKISNYNNAQK